MSALSKDMRLPEHEREAAYMKALAEAPFPVTICKLADIFDNLLDSDSLSREQRQRIVDRSQMYLSCLGTNLPDMARPAFGDGERSSRRSRDSGCACELGESLVS